jgi:hypothetical protein
VQRLIYARLEIIKEILREEVEPTLLSMTAAHDQLREQLDEIRSQINPKPQPKKRGRKKKEESKACICHYIYKALESDSENTDAVDNKRSKKSLGTHKAKQEAEEEEDEEYVLEEIVGERKFGRNKLTKYECVWKGYKNPEENTWEPYEHVKDTSAFKKYAKAKVDRAET